MSDDINVQGDAPDDVTALSDDELNEFESNAIQQFDSLTNGENVAGDEVAQTLARAEALAGTIEELKGERERRKTVAAEAAAQREELRRRVHGDASAFQSNDEGTENGESEVVESEPEVVPTPAVVAGGATTNPVSPKRKLNVPLSEISRRAPAAEAPRRNEAVLVASADIPGFTQGGRINGMDGLVKAMYERSKNLGDGRGAHNYIPVASLQREHKYTLGPDALPEQISDVLQAAANPESLVAAGGWCAPSEISYDFFNIVCEDGMLDLPTVGINRGGIRFPVSPSFGDLVGNAGLFSWNETQDIAAVTGTAQSGTKTCGIVPCATFTEKRLACNGICLTVGNLMNDAFPELIANHTQLLFAAHAHQLNQLRIANLVADSVSVSGTTGLGAAGAGVVAPVLGAVEMQAIDYREKYRMCQDSVLEVVLPRWIRGMLRSDLRRRTGISVEEWADAYLMRLFDALNVRVQWVTDWQVGSGSLPGQTTPIEIWPTQVSFLIYAPGTFVLGQGLKLDLGVVRDSTLNATNDFTATWMEECWLIAKTGHESRYVTVNVCADGTTGAADLTACAL